MNSGKCMDDDKQAYLVDPEPTNQKKSPSDVFLFPWIPVYSARGKPIANKL
jgi:hypothetical protein